MYAHANKLVQNQNKNEYYYRCGSLAILFDQLPNKLATANSKQFSMSMICFGTHYESLYMYTLSLCSQLRQPAVLGEC